MAAMSFIAVTGGDGFLKIFQRGLGRHEFDRKFSAFLNCVAEVFRHQPQAENGA
jgi:hypothetical protein